MNQILERLQVWIFTSEKNHLGKFLAFMSRVERSFLNPNIHTFLQDCENRQSEEMLRFENIIKFSWATVIKMITMIS